MKTPARDRWTWLCALGSAFSGARAASAQCLDWNPAAGQPGTNAFVHALAVFDDGSGPALYVGGGFTIAGGVNANRVAKWDGSTWSALGSGMNEDVWEMIVFDDGGGDALYVAGQFTIAGGVAANRIARWDGTSWSTLGSGMPGGSVSDLAVFDDGSGPALYAAGSFVSAGGVNARNIAKWSGTSWSALGSGLTTSQALSLAVFDDGSGSALYAGGDFTTAGGSSANRIAKWNGTSWSALGSGMDLTVRALSPFDDGSGPALYAGGSFTTAGGVSVSRIAKWNGSTWSALGGGMDNAVTSLAVFDDGSGDALYAGGGFFTAGGVSARRIAKWDGASWSALGSGVFTASVYAMTPFDDGTDGVPDLYVGGEFSTAGGLPAACIAEWGGCDPPELGEPFCFPTDAGVTNCPCAPPNTVPNPQAAPGHGCANSLNLSGALLTAAGTTAPDTVTFTVDVAPTYLGFGLLVKGNANAATGIPASDGVRCVNGQLIRFGGHNAGTNGNPMGQWIYPNSAQTTPVSAATLQPSGESAYYQLFYRNAAASFCTSATANWSNGYRIDWP